MYKAIKCARNGKAYITIKTARFSHIYAIANYLWCIVCAFLNCYNFNRCLVLLFFLFLFFGFLICILFLFFAISRCFCYCCWLLKYVFSSFCRCSFPFQWLFLAWATYFEWVEANVFIVDLLRFKYGGSFASLVYRWQPGNLASTSLLQCSIVLDGSADEVCAHRETIVFGKHSKRQNKPFK